MTDVDTRDWPQALVRIATLIGPERALELARRVGGLERVWVPREPNKEHPWATVLTPTEFRELAREYGGQHVHLPRGCYVRLQKRRIIELASEGRSKREIALTCQVGERYVRRVLAMAGIRARQVDPRQGKLFE